jgi:hypothetical protein
MALRVVLYVIAALLLGAHFLREGNFIAVAFCAASPLLFLVRRFWTLIVLQVMAYSAAGIWILTALHLVDQRQLEGRPWTTAAAILGAVALLSVLSGLLLNSKAIRERYSR